MIQYNGILCIEGGELIRSEVNPEGLVSFDNYKKLCQRRRIRVIKRGCNSSPALIDFSSLPEKYRAAWIATHGDPEKQVVVEPFLRSIRPDADARDFYETYRYGNSESLDMERVKLYSDTASILNAIKLMIKESEQVRKPLGKSNKGMWTKILAHVDSAREFYEFDLPRNSISLKRKYQRYVDQGYYSLIHAGYGNRNSSVINTPTAEALLIQLLSHGNKLSSPEVAKTYNIWAEANGMAAITDRTVNAFKIARQYEITASRDGSKVWNNRYDKVIGRSRPSAPLLLINSDDNDLDLYFKAEYTTRHKGQVVVVKNDWFRFKAYIVIDAYCDYILGYAIGEQITTDLVKEAYRNAANHVKELTGGYYLPHQIVADHWQLKALTPFYESLGVFTPPALGNARSKVIERFFGIAWHNELKRYGNYAGTNITAKTKSNSEFIAANMKDRPTMAEGKLQIAQFIESMRNRQFMDTGKSCVQVWKEGFAASEVAKERRIGAESYYMTYGIPCTRQHRITNRDLEITIDGNDYRYDIPDAIYRTAVGKRVQVYYNPEDMSHVMASDGAKLRFVASEYKSVPMAIKDMQAGDKARLDGLLGLKRKRRQEVKDSEAERKALLDRANIDAQSLLQAGILIKEARFKSTEIATRIAAGDTSDDIWSLT